MDKNPSEQNSQNSTVVRSVKDMTKQISVYVPSKLLAQFLGFFTAIIMRRSLNPEEMGIWSTAMMIMSYMGYVELGIRSNIIYRVPILKGQGKKHEIDNLQNLIFTYLTIAVGSIALILALYTIIARNSLRPLLFAGLLGVSVIICGERVFANYVSVLRANKRFELLSRSTIFDAIVNFSLVFLLVRAWGYYGLIISSVAMPLLNVFYLKAYEKVSFKPRWNTKEFIECIRFSAPIFSRNWLGKFLNNIDKIMIVSFLGFTPMGLFSIATMTKNYSHGLYHNFGHVINPYLLEHFGSSGDIKSSSKFVEIPTLIFSYMMTFVLGTAFFLSAPVVWHVLPEYTDGLPALRIYLLNSYFVILSNQAVTLIVALKKQTKLIPVTIVGIFMNLILNYMVIRQGYGIAGVAATTSFTALIMFILTYIYAMKHCDDASSITIQLIKIAFPALYASVFTALICRYHFFDSIILNSVLQWILFCVVFLPSFYILDRQVGICGFLKKWIAEKLRR